MKHRTHWIVLISLTVLATGVWPAMGGDDSKHSDYFVDRIRRAPGPEEAIAAYVQGQAQLGGDHKPLNDAFVRKMVDFGQVEPLQPVALRLVARDKKNALGNAVLAWHYARQQRMVEAFERMEKAADKDDDHPFIQDLGGQLIAWYDVTRKRLDLPEKIDDAAEEIVDELEDKRLYKESYRTTVAELLGQRVVIPPPVPVLPPAPNIPPPAYRYEPVPQYRYETVPQHREARGGILPGLRFFFSLRGRDSRRFDDDRHFKFDDDDHGRRRFKHDD